MTLPIFIRKFAVDFVETAVALVFGLALVFPSSASEVQQVAVVVGGALLSAAVSSLRRAAPDFILWFRGVADLPADEDRP